jgi:alpha-tubulin suppressor-like RCC1 family protein
MTRPNQFLSPEGDLEDYFVDEYWLIDQWVGDTLLGAGSIAGLGINLSSGFAVAPVQTFARGTNWKQVSGGRSIFTGAIKTDGTLWMWGRNYNGQLGNSSFTDRSTPVTTFAGGTNWKQVACGGYHTAAIKTDGTLWTWGRNSSGQLGINLTTSFSVPRTTFSGGTNWKQVSCGDTYTAAIKTDGTLWTWGLNSSGQLGTNNVITRSTPVTTFAGGSNWKQVSCGRFHTMAVKTDGTLWTWGLNSNGQLGINNTTSRSTPVTTFIGGNNWKQVAGGNASTVAIRTNGTLWVWGLNTSGQLGDNTTTQRNTPVTTFAGGTNWKQVSCGFSHTAAIKTDGTLWTWGYNYQGQLGIGRRNAPDPRTPVTTITGGTNWKHVGCGGYHTSVVTSGTDPTYFIS